MATIDIDNPHVQEACFAIPKPSLGAASGIGRSGHKGPWTSETRLVSP